jgi:hypothetical protein
MATVTLSNNELLHFRRNAQQFINTHPERTKLHYALEKVIKKTTKAAEDYADKENDHRVDAALLDSKTKAFINDDKGNLTIDPSKMKELNKQLRALSRENVEFETHFATEVPPDLEAGWYQVFLGVVIEEDKDPILKEKTGLKEPAMAE